MYSNIENTAVKFSFSFKTKKGNNYQFTYQNKEHNFHHWFNALKSSNVIYLNPGFVWHILSNKHCQSRYGFSTFPNRYNAQAICYCLLYHQWKNGSKLTQTLHGLLHIPSNHVWIYSYQQVIGKLMRNTCVHSWFFQWIHWDQPYPFHASSWEYMIVVSKN